MLAGGEAATRCGRGSRRFSPGREAGVLEAERGLRLRAASFRDPTVKCRVLLARNGEDVIVDGRLKLSVLRPRALHGKYSDRRAGTYRASVDMVSAPEESRKEDVMPWRSSRKVSGAGEIFFRAAQVSSRGNIRTGGVQGSGFFGFVGVFGLVLFQH